MYYAANKPGLFYLTSFTLSKTRQNMNEQISYKVILKAEIIKDERVNINKLSFGDDRSHVHQLTQ